jgi:hypothetical protein
MYPGTRFYGIEQLGDNFYVSDAVTVVLMTQEP